MTHQAEVVDIRWEDTPDRVYLYGHGLDPAAALSAAFIWWEDYDEDTEPPNLRLLGERWARWVDEETGEPLVPPERHPTRWLLWDDCLECDPGAMAVTIVIDADEADRVAAERAAIRAHADELCARVARVWPEATDIRPNGYPLDDGVVRFRCPEMLGDVIWREREPGVVQVERRDVVAWERLYAGRMPTSGR
jgi:hypothetical protein